MASTALRCLLAACLSRASFGAAETGAGSKPNILLILLDDLGFSELGYKRVRTPTGATKEVQTPHIDELVKEGIDLDRHYVHQFCSPTRCALQSGRAPIHVNVINAEPSVHNPEDAHGGFAGIPRGMTGVAEVLRRAGYQTHMAGKWDVGMATPDHLPSGRGYDTSLFYFHHSNDYWTFKGTGSCGDTEITDLWNKYGTSDGLLGAPAKFLSNADGCSDKQQHPGDDVRCMYEDALFEDRVTKIIQAHNASHPFFIFWSTHVVHGPLQVPDEQLAKFSSFIDTDSRARYHSMVNWIDGAIGRVVSLLKTKDMYKNTLIVLFGDNGGALESGGNNYPLKGGKFSNWEGGIRVAGFVSGGFLPEGVRGTRQAGLMAAWDWYATFAFLAGVDPTDHRAAEAGLPPLDSENLWPLLSGKTKTSPRKSIAMGANEGGDMIEARKNGETRIGGLIKPPHKLILGHGPNHSLDYAGWTGPQWPNATVPRLAWDTIRMSCGRTPETGCLFDIYADPAEHTNLAAKEPELYKKLLEEAEEAEKTVYSPVRGKISPAACGHAMSHYGGYWGPFVDVGFDTTAVDEIVV